MVSPSWSRMAASKAAALARRRVVSTTRKPSLAKRWARAPPIPQRAPTGRSLSSTSPPWASLVLRPSACHLEVAPTMTATGRLVVMTVHLLLDDAPSGRQEPGGTSAPYLAAVDQPLLAQDEPQPKQCWGARRTGEREVIGPCSRGMSRVAPGTPRGALVDSGAIEPAARTR